MTNLERLNEVFKNDPTNKDLIAELFTKATFIDGHKLSIVDYMDHNRKPDLRTRSSKDHNCMGA